MPHSATYKPLLNQIYYMALFSWCCFYVPYEITLKRISGYGIATNRCNSRRIRSKGWILYAFLWWLPFVMGLIGGGLLLSYFACENLLILSIFLAKILPRLAAVALEFLKNILHEFIDITSEIFFASIELAGDFCWLISKICIETSIELRGLFKRRQEPEAAPQNPWEEAIIMPGLKKSVHDSWQEVSDISFFIRKMQNKAQKHERDESKKQSRRSQILREKI